MICLNQEIHACIIAHVQDGYPEECCGVLLGTVREAVREVREVLLLENARTDERRTRFLITPRDYLRAEKAAREAGLELIGFYHSHPDQPARPSEYDREHALPWHSYLIVSVYDGEPRAMRSWILDEDRQKFSQEELTIIVGARIASLRQGG